MVKKILATTLLVLISVNTSGCALLLAGAAAGGTGLWLNGKLIHEVNVPFDKSIQAAKSALRSLKLEVTKETKADNVAQIKSTYTDGKTIWIDIHKVSETASRIEVRVGMISDEDASRIILNKIIKYL